MSAILDQQIGHPIRIVDFKGDETYENNDLQANGWAM
jgi:hypothetical protein